MIDQARLDNLVRAAKERFRPSKIILFGSQARGDAHAGSALDLCLIVPEAGDWLERQIEFRGAVDLPEVAVEPFIFTSAEFQRLQAEGNPFVLTILEEGRVLYEQQ
jgi:predicted nucleotidyltransferase